VTGCLHPTPAKDFPILADIQPAELSQRSHTVSSMPCYGASTSASLNSQPFTWCEQTASQKLRHPFVPAAQQHISSSDNNNRSMVLWVDQWRNVEWLENTARLYIPSLTSAPTLWEWLCKNRL